MKKRIEELENVVRQLQTAVQVSQAVIKRIYDSSIKHDAEINNTMGVLNDLQYRTLAMIKCGNFDKTALDVAADELKLNDFNKASDAEDSIKGFVDGTVTTEKSIVIITSTTNSADDNGIFRSKFAIADAAIPSLKETLIGKKVGDKVEMFFNGTSHIITILAVKELPVLETAIPETACVCEDCDKVTPDEACSCEDCDCKKDC